MDSWKRKSVNDFHGLACGQRRVLGQLMGALLLVACLNSFLVERVQGQEQISLESRELKQSPNNENELSDDLKYLEKLEKLDQYWSELARPRFGRSEYKQPKLLGFRMQRQQPIGSGPASSLAARQLGARSPLELRAGSGLSLADLLNARLAQRYNSNEAY